MEDDPETEHSEDKDAILSSESRTQDPLAMYPNVAAVLGIASKQSSRATRSRRILLFLVLFGCLAAIATSWMGGASTPATKMMGRRLSSRPSFSTKRLLLPSSNRRPATVGSGSISSYYDQSASSFLTVYTSSTYLTVYTETAWTFVRQQLRLLHRVWRALLSPFHSKKMKA